MAVRKVAQDYTKIAYGRADWKFGKTPKYGREIRIFTGNLYILWKIWKFTQKVFWNLAKKS